MPDWLKEYRVKLLSRAILAEVEGEQIPRSTRAVVVILRYNPPPGWWILLISTIQSARQHVSLHTCQ